MYFFLSLPPILYINTVRSQSTPKASFSSIPPPLQSLVTSPKVSSLVNTPSYKSKIAAVLSSAIQCKTISYDFSSSAESPQTDYTQLTKLHKLLATSFPKAHKLLKKEQVNKYSLVYTWEGTDKSLKPIMICSHLDVVPAPENNENASMNWTHPPFAGKVVDGEIWGRGAIDNKHNVVGQLAAVELLLEHDPSFAPQRTIIIAMGHDEEICGDQGAFFIEKHLFKTRKDLPKTNGFEAIFDEGPMMVEGAMPGFMGNAALIANAEKGAVTLELRVDTAGGHSSMPPIKEEGAVSIIAKAVTKLEANPFPAKFSRGSNMRKQLQFLSPMFSTPMRVVTSNLWLFSPLLKKVLLRASNGAAAMLRTTTAVTVIQGGDKYNVLPYTVKAYVNHRIHPEDTLEGVIEYDKKVIDDDRIKVTVVGGVTPASKVSSLTSNSFAWVKESVANVFNNPSTCSLMIGNTDTRHYWNLSNDIYRFSPVNLHVKELGMFHGLNERISVDNLAGVCLYYRELMLRAQQK
ncbi:hypothetical protein ScalyP_jg8964 [Parmales sp. scaly parma]|nr:hypothetical protein ScalyP_jg8964 [Parmales sp. scaly parma]